MEWKRTSSCDLETRLLSRRAGSVKKIRCLAAVSIFVACALGVSQGQNDGAVPSGENAQQSSGTPAPAFGGNTAATASDNPPISGLDQPSLEPNITARSFLQPGVQVSDSVDSNLTTGLT